MGEVVRWVLAPGFARFAKSHPHVRLRILSDNRVSSLAAGEADIAVRLARPTEGDLVVKKLFTERYAYFVERSMRVSPSIAWLGLTGSLAEIPEQRHAVPPKVAIEPDLATAPLHTIPTDLPALSTVQLDKASITPAPVLLRETAQVNKEQLAALVEGLAGAPTENVPALRKSAMGVWIGVGIAAAIALALAAWALFVRRPM